MDQVVHIGSGVCIGSGCAHWSQVVHIGAGGMSGSTIVVPIEKHSLYVFCSTSDFS